ncbi:MAG: hypothetical protein BECKG1743E_GA0114224_106691, partial [Candidatus Kentron sp. G]
MNSDAVRPGGLTSILQGHGRKRSQKTRKRRIVVQCGKCKNQDISRSHAGANAILLSGHFLFFVNVFRRLRREGDVTPSRKNVSGCIWFPRAGVGTDGSAPA